MSGLCNNNVCVPLQPGYLTLLHYLGAAVSFLCICFYSVLLTALTGKCVLTGLEKFLYPARIVSTAIQIMSTIVCILPSGLPNLAAVLLYDLKLEQFEKCSRLGCIYLHVYKVVNIGL